MSYYAGGELLSLHVCKALQDVGFEVTLACDVFDPVMMERIYGMGSVMRKCEFFQVPGFRPKLKHFRLIERLEYEKRIWSLFNGVDYGVVFSTQSSSSPVSGRLFHFVYNISDLFYYPAGSSPYGGVAPTLSGKLLSMVQATWRRLFWDGRFRIPERFLAVGSQVLEDLRGKGFQNSSLVYPPCRVNFKPSFPKKKQVIQVARVIPDKRLELFFQIAEMLPEYPFYLIGRRSQKVAKEYPKYFESVMSKLAKNTIYVDSTLSDASKLLEESKAYLYTGNERGMVMTVVEAISAGCVPFSPYGTGGADIIQASNVGGLYRTANEAAIKLRASLEKELGEADILRISEKAKLFSAEEFHRSVRRIVDAPIGNSKVNS